MTLRTAAGVPKPRNDYHVSLISVGDSAVAGDDYPDVSLTLAVPPADWKADGAGFAASVPVSVATVNDSDVEADERFYLAVASSIGQLPLGLECPAGLRNVGGATSCSTAVTIEDDEFGVTGVTVTSMPQKASDTYGARENIEFAVAFNRPVTVTGAPVFYFRLGTGDARRDNEDGDLVCGLGHEHAAVLLRRAGRDGRRPGHGRDFLAVGLAGARRRHDRAGGRDGGPESDLPRPAGPHRPQGGRADDARRDGHRDRGGDLGAAADGVRIDDGPDTYGRQETIEIAVTASEAVEVIGDPVFRFTIGADPVRAAYDRMNSTADEAGVHLHGEGGRHGPRRDRDRRRQHHLRPGLERPHPHGRAKDRHRPQPHRSRHADRPQGGRLADRGRQGSGTGGAAERGEGVHRPTHADLRRAARRGLGAGQGAIQGVATNGAARRRR